MLHGAGFWPMTLVLSSSYTPTTLGGLMLLRQLLLAYHVTWRGNRFGAQQSTDLSAFMHGGEVSSFPGLVPPNDMVNSRSVVGVKFGNSSVVIGYQVDNPTHTWLEEHFVGTLQD